MEETEQQTPEKSQGSHQQADLAAPSGPDGAAMEPSLVPCNNRKCSRYREMIVPEVDGLTKRCPHCGTMVKGSKLAQRYSLDETDVACRAEQHVRDFHADTAYLRGFCEELAECDLSIKKVRKGSAEHQRLYAIRENLIAKLEAHCATRRVESDGTTDGRVVFYIPENGREYEPSADTPGAAGSPREATPTVEPAAPAAVAEPAAPSAPQPEYLVPERVVSENGRKSEIRMRAVTEDDVLRCMDRQGDAENYRRGLIPRFVAYQQTANWIKAQFN